MTDNMNGIADLHAKRQRRSRQAPPPRHPKTPWSPPERPESPTPTTTAAGGPDKSDQQSSPQPVAASAMGAGANAALPADNAATTEPAPAAPPSADVAPTEPAPAAPLPRLDIDLTDSAAHLVSPTVLSVPASIIERFEQARVKAPSHTALVLDALRAHAEQLPALILRRRPSGNPQDLFPWRATPGLTSTETPMPLRIRPTNGELAVMRTLISWASEQIIHHRPGERPTNRSEMVTAALDAYLPDKHAKRKK